MIDFALYLYFVDDHIPAWPEIAGRYATRESCEEAAHEISDKYPNIYGVCRPIAEGEE